MRDFARVLAALMVCLVIACASPALGAIIRVKWDSPTNGPGNDWDHAYHTVAAGLNAANSIQDNPDEVWVAGDAAHPYVERITLKNGVGLYGGFAGTETSKDKRNWGASVTILNGTKAGTVVTSPYQATASTIIDGFTIRNGNDGGIYCNYSSPTISNNTILANTANSYGGGIYCSGSPTICNSTIAANTGSGIYCQGSSATIANKIVAFNSSGVYNGLESNLILKNNCIYNPGGSNYFGLSPGATDIQLDPKLAAVQHGQVHIKPDSPCRDAGSDSFAGQGSVDMDGQARIQGKHVDIGADESYGTTRGRSAKRGTVRHCAWHNADNRWRASSYPGRDNTRDACDRTDSLATDADK